MASISRFVLDKYSLQKENILFFSVQVSIMMIIWYNNIMPRACKYTKRRWFWHVANFNRIANDNRSTSSGPISDSWNATAKVNRRLLDYVKFDASGCSFPSFTVFFAQAEHSTSFVFDKSFNPLKPFEHLHTKKKKNDCWRSCNSLFLFSF